MSARCWPKRQSKTAVSFYPWMAFSRRRSTTLYVLREVFSGTVLAAKNMKSGSAAELQTLILSVIELGFPIVGIVSDGQHSIRLAFERLRPDVPYQYCQYH
nr:hypothetical protein [Aneurinibacillus sp. XH2]